MLLAASGAPGSSHSTDPTSRLDDERAYERWRLGAAALGFDGKWAIHPDQVATLNEVFTPSVDEVARAEAILGALDDAASDRRPWRASRRW